MTWRRLALLIRRMPADSELVRERWPQDPHAWRREHYMLADIFDVLALANWQRGGAKSKHKPTRYPRPGDEPTTNRLDRAEVSAGLERLERKRRLARLRAQGVSDA